MTPGTALALVSTTLIVPMAIAAVTWLEARLPETRRAAETEQRTPPVKR